LRIRSRRIPTSPYHRRVDRLRVWLTVSPLIAAGVVVAHGLAYRLTGTPEGPMHGYLDHMPQLLLVLVVAGLALGGLEQSRLGACLRLPAAWPFPMVALATFVLQEHLERFVHTGHLPWLLGSRVFLVGLVLQLPIALVVWALARKLLCALRPFRAAAPRLPRHSVAVVPAPTLPIRVLAIAAPLGRGPPHGHAS
jgi:hypothetical protein